MSCEHCGGPVGRTYGFICDPCQRIKGIIRHEVVKAIRSGALPKASDCACVDCGIPAREYDHRDYAKPLQVDPVCRGCNLRRGIGLMTPKTIAKFHATKRARPGRPRKQELSK